MGLDMTRPYFRCGNAVKFYNDSKTESILINPHEAIVVKDGMFNVIISIFLFSFIFQFLFLNIFL